MICDAKIEVGHSTLVSTAVECHAYNDPKGATMDTKKQRQCCCLQGATEHGRRNCTGLFADLSQAREVLEEPNFELQIFSWSTLDPQIVLDLLLDKIVYKPLKYPVCAPAI